MTAGACKHVKTCLLEDLYVIVPGKLHFTCDMTMLYKVIVKV